MTAETSIYEYAKQNLMIEPDKMAIWFYGTSITYRELFEKIDNVADHFYVLGVREGTVVTIHLPNCPQAVMAIYAVAKLGGICNMVHPQMPRLTLLDNMQFAESGILITFQPDCASERIETIIANISYHMSSAFQSEFPAVDAADCRLQKTVPFELLEKKCSDKASIPDQFLLAEKCAVYMHSSGTTGTPKTVMHNHLALNSWVQNMFDGFFHCNSLKDEIGLAVVPLFHGTGLVVDMHELISGGGALVQMLKWDEEYAIQLMKNLHVTYSCGVPKMYMQFARDKRFCSKELPSLWRCAVGGEPVSIDIKKQIDDKFPRCRLMHEGYGMTEIVSACFLTGHEHDRIDASGYPMHDTCVAVVRDADGTISPEGEGEFLVSTNTMMMGYLKDDKATSESMLVWNGKRWFCTGDYGYIRDGYLFFKGRIKNMLIHNGHNIFPNEIENVLLKHPSVTEAYVIGKYNQSRQTEEIWAYIATEPDDQSVELKSSLVKHCIKFLPRYAVPQFFALVESLPRNSSGKVDIAQLEQQNEKYGN